MGREANPHFVVCVKLQCMQLYNLFMRSLEMKQLFISVAFVILFACLAGCATSGTSGYEERRQAEAIRQLGEAYLAEQNYTMALAEFLKAEKLNPDDHLLYQDLGIAYMAKGELDLAVKHFQKALDIKPDFASARNNLGAAYLARKDWDAAIESFQLLSKDLLYGTPHYPLSNLGKAYYEKKELVEAEKYYKEALKVEPGFVNALFGLGKTYLSMGKVTQAVKYFEYAVAAEPLFTEAQFEMAHAHRLLGNSEKAKEGFTRVIELSPDSDLGREAKQALFDLE